MAQGPNDLMTLGLIRSEVNPSVWGDEFSTSLDHLTPEFFESLGQ